jgi:hypothetical protein
MVFLRWVLSLLLVLLLLHGQREPDSGCAAVWEPTNRARGAQHKQAPCAPEAMGGVGGCLSLTALIRAVTDCPHEG